MSTTVAILSCLGMFCLGLLMIVAGFFLYGFSTGTGVILHRRMAQGLALLCLIASAGFIEYSNYLLFSGLN